MASLPTRSQYLTNGYTSVSGADLANIDQTTCSICTGELEEPIRLHDEATGGKDHVYCRDCVLTWFEEKTTCPMCRQVLFTADAPTLPQPDVGPAFDVDDFLAAIEAIDVDDDDEDEEMLAADANDDMEVLVQLRVLGNRLRHENANGREWWHLTGEEPMRTVLSNRAAAFQEGTLEIAHGTYSQRYVPINRRRPYPQVPCDFEVAALTACLRDAYFSRLFTTIGVVDLTNDDAAQRRSWNPTAACHPLATMVHDTLRTAIPEARVTVGSRISPPRLEQSLRGAIASNEWLGHLTGAWERRGAYETPAGMEEYVQDLIAEVLVRLWRGEDAVPGAPRRSRAAQRAATGQGCMASARRSARIWAPGGLPRT
ncbi:hypothetical protein B0A55_01441 [Friedmanniomyces simplex]|uniref:RING-type domain-containing protein n=1 Tax=Friedmanniomyces simplex TaxID=329884 RepID=A0A4U0XZW7_9PEZI|nr:hypothetical protein B0A55_01441 [Friedmanniomyces simplex]